MNYIGKHHLLSNDSFNDMLENKKSLKIKLKKTWSCKYYNRIKNESIQNNVT